MKKILILAAAAAMYSCSNPKQYTIEGAVEGPATMVYMYEDDNIVDSASVENGKFRFEGIAEAPAMRYIIDSPDGQPQSFGAEFFVEPGTIVFENDAEQPQMKYTTGTPANDAAKAYKLAATALVKEFRAPETTEERREAIEEEFEKLGKDAIEQNRNNYFGATTLASQASGMESKEIMDEIAKFAPEIQQSKALTDLAEMAQQKMKTDIGQPYINIIQSDPQGQIITLTSVIENPANKYTLVDFWASWCRPCMAEVPVLKKTYDEFHAKGFEIYGVSFDKSKEAWLAAIADNKLNWIHVSDVNGFDNPAAKDYAVRGIPSNFLIDAQGKIVASNLRGEELYEKISELLK